MTLRVFEHVGEASIPSVYEQTVWIDRGWWSALVDKPRNARTQALADHWIPIARDILDPHNTLT